jgi:peptidoglycan/LPS O-acetylase OafA/YrhL
VAVTDKSRSTHVRDLDALRGIAIFGVVMTHVASSLGLMGMFIPGTRLDLTQFFVTGGLGVPLFFVLSGYLLTITESRRRAAGTGSVAAYAGRRFFRLAPAYYVSLGLYVALALQADDYHPWINPLIDTTAYLGFVHGLWWQMGSSVNNSFWSLTCEIVFYVSLPLILRFAPTIRARVLLYLLLLTVSAICYYTFGRDPESPLGWYLVFHPATHLHIFIAGSLLASLNTKLSKTQPTQLRRSVGDALLLLALTEIILNAYIHSTSPTAIMVSRLGTETFVAVGFAAYVVGSPLLRCILALPGLARLGLISYSIFLFHNLGLDVAQQSGIVSAFRADAGSGTPVLVLFTLYLAGVLCLSIAIAGVTYKWIEAPGMQGFGFLPTSRNKASVKPALEPAVSMPTA